MTDFKSFLSYEEFEEIIFKSLNNSSSVNNDELYSKLRGSLYLYIQNKIKNEEIYPFFNSHEHNEANLNVWNTFFKDQELKESEQKDIFSTFSLSRNFLMWIYQDQVKERTAEELKEQYQNIVDKINRGDFAVWDRVKSCTDCGKELYLSFCNWQGTLYESSYDNKNYATEEEIFSNFVAAQPCISKENTLINVEFKTGDILIANDFDIPEMKNILKNKDKNTSWLRQSYERTIELAYKMNIVQLLVNYDSYSIRTHDGKVMLVKDSYDFAEYDSENDYENAIKSAKKYSKKGNVLAVGKNILMMEKKTLVDLLIPSLGDKAEQVVSEYINNKQNNVTQIKLKPGTYQMEYNYFKNLSIETQSEEEKSLFKTVFELTPVRPLKMKMKKR